MSEFKWVHTGAVLPSCLLSISEDKEPKHPPLLHLTRGDNVHDSLWWEQTA